MARMAPVAASMTMTAPWPTPEAAPAPSSRASRRASTTAWSRLSDVVRRMASAPCGTAVSDWSAIQSANQPAVAGRGGKAMAALAASASGLVIAPVSAMAARTSRAREAAAAGSARGLMRDGARGSPASTADCQRFRRRADTPKYMRAAASTPQAPLPR